MAGVEPHGKARRSAIIAVGSTRPSAINREASWSRSKKTWWSAQHRELAMEAAEQGVSLNRLISKKLGAR